MVERESLSKLVITVLELKFRRSFGNVNEFLMVYFTAGFFFFFFFYYHAKPYLQNLQNCTYEFKRVIYRKHGGGTTFLFHYKDCIGKFKLVT